MSSWPTAQTSAPKKCPSGHKLGKPRYDNPNYRYREKVWHTECLVCDLDFVWSWPNVYKTLPIKTPFTRGTE